MSDAGSMAGKERPAKLTSVTAGFDIASVRCGVEVHLHGLIQNDKDLVARLGNASTNRDESVVRHRMSLMTDGYRVDAAITPLLAQLGVVLARALRLVHPLDVFVIPSHEQNAYCLPSRRGNRLVMCLHSGLLSRLNTQELLFVMGHEVGHAILKHADVPNVGFDNPNFSPLEVIKLRALRRASEISCDRFGLLACQDVRTACSALFKVASGLSERWISFDENAYSRHFDELASISELISFDDASRSHPLSPLRVKALISFSRSEALAKAFRRSEWRISSVDMEREIENMLSVIAPDFSELEGKDEEEAANRFLFDGALLMIGADGCVSPEEVAWLQQRTASELDAEKLTSDTTNPQFRQELTQRLEANSIILVNKLPQTARAQLLRVMCDIAVCAGGVLESEFEVLNALRECLDIPVEVAKRALCLTESEAAETDEPVEDTSDESPAQEDSTNVNAGPVVSVAPRPSDPLEAILVDSKLPDKVNVEAKAFCDQLRTSGMAFLFAVRGLVSWAILSSGDRGLLNAAQARRIAIAAINVSCDVQNQRGVIRKPRANPLDKLVRKHGTIALFSRNETVFLGLEDKTHVILSISRVNNTLVIAPTDDLQTTIEVSPHDLRKDPNEGDWPAELSNV